MVRKALIPTVLCLLYDFLSLKNCVNVASKSNKQKILLQPNQDSLACQLGLMRLNVCLTYHFLLFYVCSTIILADLPTKSGDVVFYYQIMSYSQ
jgi:hypothetical protein